MKIFQGEDFQCGKWSDFKLWACTNSELAGFHAQGLVVFILKDWLLHLLRAWLFSSWVQCVVLWLWFQGQAVFIHLALLPHNYQVFIYLAFFHTVIKYASSQSSIDGPTNKNIYNYLIRCWNSLWQIWTSFHDDRLWKIRYTRNIPNYNQINIQQTAS